jgi:nucleotide-binding universal stress UspA family protein
MGGCDGHHICCYLIPELYGMKTILVLTDFSINADYVGQYALKLAQNIGANILLCNIYQVPAGEETNDRASWPVGESEENSINDLGAQLAQLKSRLDAELPGNGSRPEITQYSQEGGLSTTLNKLAATNDILMAMISMHSADNISEYFATDHAWDVVNNARFPVMVIPYQARFTPFKLIAFATAMNYTDINILESISGLAKYSDSEIIVTNVTDGEHEDGSVKKFFRQIPGKINYPKILYHHIAGSDVAAALKRLCAFMDIDLLVIVHQRRNLFQKLFGGSVTRKMTGEPGKPILIFPCYAVKETLTVF